MYIEVEKIQKAKEIIHKVANGVNPFSGEQILNDGLLKDAEMVRCFCFVSDVLDDIARGNYKNRRNALGFVITPEQKYKIVLPEGKIGVNGFSKCINLCINQVESKRLTGVEINKRLKKMGILAEESTEEGKTRTITNEKSIQYGFEMVKKNFNGVEYDMVLINDIGKKYLLENLEVIMAVEL
jgi:hypothetical protein